MQSLSFATSGSTLRLLPWWVLEKPHCGDRHRFSSGTNFDAASMRRFAQVVQLARAQQAADVVGAERRAHQVGVLARQPFPSA